MQPSSKIQTQQNSNNTCTTAEDGSLACVQISATWRMGNGGITPCLLSFDTRLRCRIMPGERAPGEQWIRGWVDPRSGLNMVVKRKIPTSADYRTPIVLPVVAYLYWMSHPNSWIRTCPPSLPSTDEYSLWNGCFFAAKSQETFKVIPGNAAIWHLILSVTVPCPFTNGEYVNR